MAKAVLPQHHAITDALEQLDAVARGRVKARGWLCQKSCNDDA